MRKRLVATLLVGAVATTAVLGLTACGGAGIDKGVEVDEQGWKDAFKATSEATNYTVELISETTSSASGKADDISVNVKYEEKSNSTSYYDVDGGKAYEKSSASMKVTGIKSLPDALKQILGFDDDIEEKEEYESYTVKEGENYYEATLEDGEWIVDEAYGVYPYSYVSNASFATEKNGEYTNISLLYSAFTYSGGIYTATLYSGSYEYTVSVSIKDGYVLGYSVESKMEGEMNGLTSKSESKVVYKFSNYGKTNVSPSKGAQDAIANK